MWGWAAFLMEFSPSHLVFIFLYMVHYKCKEERGGTPEALTGCTEPGAAEQQIRQGNKNHGTVYHHGPVHP